MADPYLTREEIDQRIADIEENLRDLVEEAAAYSGANDEERSSERINEQQRELDELKARRDLLG